MLLTVCCVVGALLLHPFTFSCQPIAEAAAWVCFSFSVKEITLCCMVTLDLFCTIDFLGWYCFYLAEEGTFVSSHLWLGVVWGCYWGFLVFIFLFYLFIFNLNISHELFSNCKFSLVMLRVIWHLCCLMEALEISPGTCLLDAHFDFWLPYLSRLYFSFFFSIFPFHLLTGRGKRQVLGNCLEVFVQSDRNFGHWWSSWMALELTRQQLMVWAWHIIFP